MSLLAPPSPHFALSPAGAAGVEVDPFAGLTALGPVPGERKARDWALVLQSMSIWHAIRRPYAGWVVLVHDEDYARAAEAIDRYEAENRDWPPRPARERLRHSTSPITPLVFAALVAFFFITGPVGAYSRWFARGTSVADLVLSSEPWRAVTALTLHADSVHVLGNAISGTVFASAVHRRLGPGGSALAILASGILGNVANALFHHSTGEGMHGSIGASTAVFGAVGILAATQTALNRPAPAERRPWTDIAGPLVGGLALLGTLGAGGPNTDLGAHLFGFLAGLVIGLAVAFPLRRAGLLVGPSNARVATGVIQLGAGSPSARVQAALGAIAVGIVVVAWQLAFRH
jgi:rhomboid protease GluP